MSSEFIGSLQKRPLLKGSSFLPLAFLLEQFVLHLLLTSWLLVGRSLVGLPKVIDICHSWSMTLLCSLPFHQELLLLRSKESENGVLGRVVFLTETCRDSEPREADLHDTIPKLEKFPIHAEKKKI